MTIVPIRSAGGAAAAIGESREPCRPRPGRARGCQRPPPRAGWSTVRSDMADCSAGPPSVAESCRRRRRGQAPSLTEFASEAARCATLATMPSHRLEYGRRLARPIVLVDGRRLLTFKDAADLLVDVFGSVNARSRALDQALESLIRAAITGERDDNEAVTDALERVLREGRLL